MATLVIDFEDMNDWLSEFDLPDSKVEGGVAVVGPAAAYAEVWEWGNARQHKQGPKTVQGINPDGETVWLSSQAPSGYIRVNEERYFNIVSMELDASKFEGKTKDALRDELKEHIHSIMEQIAEVISEHAPIDTGQLKSSFEVVEDGDILLTSDTGDDILLEHSRILNIMTGLG